MNQRRLGVLLIIAGVALGLVAGIIVYVQVESARSAQANIPRTWVVVAAVPIPERTTINSTQVMLAQLPDSALPAQAIFYRAPEGVSTEAGETEARRLLLQDKGAVVGKFTPGRISKGEVINLERLGEEALKNTPSFVLEPGKVAYAFPVRLTGGQPSNDRLILPFLNAIRPGDRFDIFFSSIEVPLGSSEAEETRASRFPTQYLHTRPVMQNIKVLNVGNFPDAAGKIAEVSRDERFLTLEVTPAQALELKWLKDAATLGGNIEIVLRSPQDTQDFEQRTVSLADMALKYNLGTGR